MIYGCISNFKVDSSSISKLHLLEKYMVFNESIHEKIHCEDFLGGYISSNRIPFDFKDKYYHDQVSGCVVIMSGSIYNIKNIFPDNKWDTTPRLLCEAYLNEGINFIRKLNGDFGVVILDPKNNTFYLVRDHLGIQPLAFTFYNNALFFSSDIVSLCRTFDPVKNINTEFLLKDFKLVNFNTTINSKIQKLLPAHYLQFKSNSISENKYWFPEKIRIDKSLSQEKMLKDLKKMVEKAVKIRCDSKYLAGTHISGGLDSGIVAALSRQEYSHQSDFYGFSWSPEIEVSESLIFDEREMVLDQCNLNNIKPVFINPSLEDYIEYSNQKRKYSSFFEENKVLIEAKKKGINLIFSGYGGDEFISKGDRGIDTDLFLKLQWKSFLKKNPITKPKKLLKRFKYEIVLPFFGILSKSFRTYHFNETRYLKYPYNRIEKKIVGKFYFYKSRKQLHLNLLYSYYLQERLEDWFINGIRSGIAYRYPLLDKDIVEYVLKIPSKLLFKDEYSRIILREISSELLPEKIRWHQAGIDPVAFHFAHKKVFECSAIFMNEINNFKKNKHINFIDFDKLIKDINSYKKNTDNQLFSQLLFTIFQIKQVHELSEALWE